ncbi:Choline-glycine betaine transporter (BetT) (PDB:2WIT) [Commensalibacter communis]|uniref:BCCT family transporter n=1 Tax=Commensalibacter communis TaxID=2972786 RepID=UPI0022FF5EA6|nr:BCCT family transporter [Commensalibacter communis]CAI3922178.1 Choline-glycine betaine transporter (BetT) (PDB:2WIT) [Commensalibacter communis]CAI3937827.1 Choline-glycine betaine transporter (BetT) (PDB:2WIT) [Commensalibacter communis]
MPHDVVSRDKTGLNLLVFLGSAVSITLFGIAFVLFPDICANILQWSQRQANHFFGWYYILVVISCLGFVIWLGFSKYGSVPLGKDDDRPEFGYLAWTSMLFSAGIGIALLYYGTAEPLDHFLRPPEGVPGTRDAARQAMVYTFLHWGVHGWALYALVGITIGYFGFRLNFPLALRSALYPIFGNKIYGIIGDLVDGFGILATVTSLVTNLGIGALVILSGVNFVFPEIANDHFNLVVVVIAMMMVATITAVVRIDKGLAILSNVNIRMLCLLLLFVFFTGPTTHLINALVQNVGDYLSQFVKQSFNLYTYNNKASDWLADWTIFYWAWWIAWAPFVGLFIARISKGRTIREVTLGVCLIPLGFTLAWLSIFGNSAIELVFQQGQTGLGQLALTDQALSLFKFLEFLPLNPYVAFIVIIMCFILFLSPVGSGTMMVASLSTKGKTNDEDSPVWLRIFWSIVITIVSISLLLAGSFGAMQNGVVLCGLPFSAILLLYIYGLATALKRDPLFADKNITNELDQQEKVKD